MVKALDRKVLRDLGILRSQTTTLALLVACGVSLLVSSWSAYRSLQLARDQFYGAFFFADVFAELERAPLDVARRLREIPGVQTLDPRIVADGLIVSLDQDEPAIGQFISTPSADASQLNRIHLRNGRMPSEDAQPPEVIVHEGFARAHELRPGMWIKALIEGQEERLRISGVGLSPEYVYALNPAAPLPDNKHFGIFWLSPRTLERLRGMSGSFNSVALKLDPDASVENVKRKADQILTPYGSLGTYARDRQISSMFVEDEISQQRISAIFYPSVFLGVAGFLIHIIIGRLVFSQRSQIATLKALGYSNLEISLHYSKLVLLMQSIGIIMGLALGAVLGHLIAASYKNFFHFPRLDFALSPSAMALGIAVGLLPGLIGAIGSIRGAYRLPPAEAMRPPSPPLFHHSQLERSGLLSRLSIRSRMTARSLTLRPWRLAMTSFGMALALAVVVLAGFWRDALGFLLETQFQRLQREDLSVSFYRPLPSSALQELARMKGVLAVEGYRSVPVRLRHMNLERETTLHGWPDATSMRLRLDSRFQPIVLPSSGLLLSRFYEEKLSIAPGDRLEVEILEGQRRTLLLPVAGFSDDLIGFSAVMEIQRLWDQLDEPPGYNFATVKIDPRSLWAFYGALLKQPEVASINVKDALYRGFQSSIGTLIKVSSIILTGFALAIAIGVMYNSVRVTFSERSWDLASLRVIGFRNGEVFALLMSEIAIQVVLCLLPGCLIGWLLAYLFAQTIHTETFGMPVIITRSTYAKAILVLLFALAASGLVVRRLLGRLALSDALKARD